MEYVWVRCGDGDDYNPFPNIQEAASYLSSRGVSLPLVQNVAYGVTDRGVFNWQNYISLFHGGETCDQVSRSLSQKEIHSLNDMVKKSNKF